MQSVLHHIHQRWGLRARRLLARSKDLYKWVQHQLKAAITTGKTISNNCYEGLYCKSHLEKHKHDSAGSEPVYMETKIKFTWFLKESDCSRDHVICFYLQTRAAVPPQHWCLCTSVHTVKESDEHMYGLWTYEEGYFSYFFYVVWLLPVLSHNQAFGLPTMTHEALWGCFCPSPFFYTWVIYLEVIFTIIALSLSAIPFISPLLLSFAFSPF